MTNWLAVRMDRAGTAEMSCIAGVGEDVPARVRKAGSRREIIIDGCVLKCAASCPRRHGIEPDMPVRLSDPGVRKRPGEDCDMSVSEATRVLAELTADVERRFGTRSQQPAPS